MEIYELAQTAADWFTTIKRGDDTIVVLKDGYPEWVRDIVYDVHDGAMMPDDWTYEQARNAFDAIAGGEMADSDDVYEYEFEGDVYTSDIVAWMGGNYDLVDETINEFGWDGVARSIITAAQYAQAAEKERICLRVFEMLSELVEDFEDEEEIYMSLCVYDPRHPYWKYTWEDDPDAPEPRSSGCACDNCYSGKDKLAMEILRLREQLRNS